MRIEVAVSDISVQADMQAVVNSANANLRMGSGVAGAIHGAAGPELEAYCRQFAPLSAGKAVLTPGFGLPNAWVIHAVAASFINEPKAELILAKALDSVMKLANEHQIESLAMPAIGTGVFKCPPELSAEMITRVLAYYGQIGKKGRVHQEPYPLGCFLTYGKRHDGKASVRYERMGGPWLSMGLLHRG